MTLPGKTKRSETIYFRRQHSASHNRLVQSSCNKCRSFVAASARLDLLEFVEKLHACAALTLPAITPA